MTYLEVFVANLYSNIDIIHKWVAIFIQVRPTRYNTHTLRHIVKKYINILLLNTVMLCLASHVVFFLYVCKHQGFTFMYHWRIISFFYNYTT